MRSRARARASSLASGDEPLPRGSPSTHRDWKPARSTNMSMPMSPSTIPVSVCDLPHPTERERSRLDHAPTPAVAPSETMPIIQAYTLRLRRISFEAHIGVSLEERGAGQELLVDVDLFFSVDDLPELDALDEAIDYDGAVRKVVEEGTAQSYRLLETYARRVVARLLADLPVSKVRVAVTKKHVPTQYPVAEAIVELIGARSSAVAGLAHCACSNARPGLHAPESG